MDDGVSERFELGRQHAELVLTMVHEVLAEAGLALNQLDAIAFGRGPGLFTGLRIGAGVVQGLAFGANLPVVPVSSLAALAQGQDADRVLAAFDARMQQVYWGAYVRNKEGMMALTGDEAVLAPQAVPLPAGKDWIGAGSGWDQYSMDLLKRLDGYVTTWREKRYPLARDVAHLGIAGFREGRTVIAEQALPVYIRDEIAVKQKRF